MAMQNELIGTPYARRVIADANSATLANRRIFLGDTDMLDPIRHAPAGCIFVLVNTTTLFFAFSDLSTDDVKVTYDAGDATARSKMPVLWGTTEGVVYSLDTFGKQYLTVYDASGASEVQIQAVR
jgi:hypothetical protein